MIDQTLIDNVESYILDGRDLPVNVTENILDAYISLVNQNAELHKSLTVIKPADDSVCNHSSCTAKMTHVKCNSCGKIKTDGGWGIASRMWFDNLEQAKFYERSGAF